MVEFVNQLEELLTSKNEGDAVYGRLLATDISQTLIKWLDGEEERNSSQPQILGAVATWSSAMIAAVVHAYFVQEGYQVVSRSVTEKMNERIMDLLRSTADA